VAGLCQSRLWGGPSWKQVIPYLQNFFMSGSHSFFDSLQEHIDYELVESTNPAFNKAIVRVNIFRQHRQTIQYIQPQDSLKLSQAELLVIDEAAAIPLPMVKALLGPYLVFLCSTVNG
jgi:N-acetyltransferase 10